MFEQEILDILGSNIYATISTVDSENKPWASPVFYVYTDQNIYWLSETTTRHSKNITRNSNVFVSIFDSTATEGAGVGVYSAGHAKEVEYSQLERIINLFNSRANVFKLNYEMFSEPKTHALYSFTPIQTWTNETSERISGYVERKIEGSSEV